MCKWVDVPCDPILKDVEGFQSYNPLLRTSLRAYILRKERKEGGKEYRKEGRRKVARGGM
jgi:hypothetical protein